MVDELKPEERARTRIDEQLADAGWRIADRDHFTYDHHATAVTEGLLEANHEVDYLLFVESKVIGVLEAKRSDIDLESAAGGQAAHYVHIIPKKYPRWGNEPKVVLLANGEKILLRDSDTGEYHPVSSIPTPKKCLALSGITSYWGGLPELREFERVRSVPVRSRP